VAKISLFNRRGNEPIVVSLVVIDVEFGRKNHCSIHITAIGMMLKSLDVTTDSRKQIKPMVKEKKNRRANGRVSRTILDCFLTAPVFTLTKILPPPFVSRCTLRNQ
jgi:hypothetical protein